MKSKVVLIIGIAIVGVIIIAFWMLSGRSGESELETAQASRRTISASVLSLGSIQAIVGAEVKVGSRISGVVEHLPVRVGSVVHKGQLIGQLDDREMRSQTEQARANLEAARARLKELEAGYEAQVVQSGTEIERAEANLQSAKSRLDQTQTILRAVPVEVASRINQAEAELEQAKANEENARVRLERLENLLAQDFIARQDVDNARTEYEVAKSKVRSAEASLDAAKINASQTEIKSQDVKQAEEAVKQAELTLKRAKADASQVKVKEQSINTARAQVSQAQAYLRNSEVKLSYTQIISPINGVVASVSTQEGEAVSAGLQTQTFVTVIDLSKLEVRALVDETDIGRVKVGHTAYFTVDSYPEEEFAGIVTAIYPKAVIDQNVVNYDVVIGIDDPLGLLRPDMTANVTINVDTREDVLVVPNRAIKREDGSRVAYVMENGELARREVRTGWRDGAYTEVISGIKHGDEVLTGDLPK